MPSLTETEKAFLPAHVTVGQEQNQLIKQLISKEDVVLQERIVTINRLDATYELRSERGWTAIADEIIVTAPLPQALELLTASGIAYDEQLQTIRYRKALVLLVVAPYAVTYVTNDSIERAICQSEDGRAWSLYLTEQASERYFAATDEVVLGEMDLGAVNVQVKRWRYALCTELNEAPFYRVPHEAITLIGDSFGQGTTSIERIFHNVDLYVKRVLP